MYLLWTLSLQELTDAKKAVISENLNEYCEEV